ncbi:hypothetical protein E4U55_001829 [Claviceps digitariae]|nr:hypothetical protein E4U55_001829 [Claviceps digitariae]
MPPKFSICRACLTRTLWLAAYSSSRSSRTVQTALRITTATAHLGRQPRARHFTTAFTASDESFDPPQSLEVPEKDVTVLQERERKKLQWIVDQHLTYIKNPWKIGKHVEQTLLKDRFDEALLLTQQASQDKQVVCAWNHLIDYQFNKRQVTQAIKLFNDMKKRGQLPTAQTYTIIFRGCLKARDPQTAVAEAVKHYDLLMADTRIQSNTIHLNAVLNVCAKAGDLDTLFRIAETANDSTRAPTNYTYTTILNALRHDADRDLSHLSVEERAIVSRNSVTRSEGLWAEVMEKWKQGRLLIDEELVCCMARVLHLTHNQEDRSAVFELLHQTMGLPKLGKMNKSSPVSEDVLENVSENVSEDVSEDVSKNSIAVPNDDNNDNNHASPPSTAFVPTPTDSKALHVTPGPNTLALVLDNLTSSRNITTGIKYWNLLVRQYGIVPDRDNWHRLFGLLKAGKASARAASTLDLVPDEYVNRIPYEIAMQTCVLDNINVNAIRNANIVLYSMLDRLPMPDIYTLGQYLRVALVSHFHFRAKAKLGVEAKTGAEYAAKREYGEQITAALARIWEPYHKLHYHYFKAMPATLSDDDIKAQDILYNKKREVVELAQLMYASYNKVILEKLLPQRGISELQSFSSKISRQIQKFYSNREEMESKPRRSAATVRAAVAERSLEEKNDLWLATKKFKRQSTTSHGGDFIWDTTRPISVPLPKREPCQPHNRKLLPARRHTL